jgi:hypothetical protein
MINAGEMMSFKHYARGLLPTAAAGVRTRVSERKFKVQPIRVGVLTMWKREMALYTVDA